jgi:hypothetical protein
LKKEDIIFRSETIGKLNTAFWRKENVNIILKSFKGKNCEKLLRKELIIHSTLLGANYFTICGIIQISTEEFYLAFYNDSFDDENLLSLRQFIYYGFLNQYNIHERIILIQKLADILMDLNYNKKIVHRFLTLDSIFLQFKETSSIEDIQIKICNFEYSISKSSEENNFWEDFPLDEEEVFVSSSDKFAKFIRLYPKLF